MVGTHDEYQLKENHVFRRMSKIKYCNRSSGKRMKRSEAKGTEGE
jgi:hypothetical protein